MKISGVGGRVVSCLPFTAANRIRFPVGKLSQVLSEIGCCQFDPTEHRRFPPGTLVSSCTNTDTNIPTIINLSIL